MCSILCVRVRAAAAMDQAGYHALTYRHLGSLACGTTRLSCTSSLWPASPAEREAPSLLPGSAARPADIFVPNFAGTQAACLDFAVTHTQQPNILHCASVCGGAAAERYEVAWKDATFGVECKAAGLVLVPMVVEVFGRWEERSVEAMKLATKRACSCCWSSPAEELVGHASAPERPHPAGPDGPCCR